MDYDMESSSVDLLGIFLIACAVVVFYLGLGFSYKSWTQINTLYEVPVLPPLHSLTLTLGQLRRYNGRRQDGRILVAFKGQIYDVSGDSEFIVGGSLNFVAGMDFSRYLNTKLPLEPMKRTQFVERWENLLKAIYSCVGTVVDHQGNSLFTRKQRNWQNNEALEDIMEDQRMLDFGNDNFQTKSVENYVENQTKSVENDLKNVVETPSNNGMTQELLNAVLSAGTLVPLGTLNVANLLVDLDLD